MVTVNCEMNIGHAVEKSPHIPRGHTNGKEAHKVVLPSCSRLVRLQL